MKDKVRKYPRFSACGLNCGLCPRYYTQGTSRCPGCAGEGFSEVHPPCGILSCSLRKGLEYCFLCDEFPCKKYDGADESDSFISHKNQFSDMERAKKMGLAAYEEELNTKVQILEGLIKNYDDGRRKNFFCIAVNLLSLEDVILVKEQINKAVDKDATLKEKAVTAAHLFEEKANEKGIALKLRKKVKG